MIKGLTDGSRFPIIGHLRKGGPKVSERQPGKDLDHFRFTPEDEDEADLTAAFHEAYGDRPRELVVYLPYATTDENLDTWLEEYAAGGLVRRCDGEYIKLHRLDDGTMSDVEMSCERHCQCKETGRLLVVLPQLERLATVMVHTTSIHDIRNLYAALKGYEEVARRSGGDLTGIPFILKRVKRKVSTPGTGGKRARRDKWLITIEPQPVWVSLQLGAAQQRALAAPEARQIGAGEVVIETARQIEGPDATELKELHTAATDYGFGPADRAVRLAFVGLMVGREVASFQDVRGRPAQYAITVMDRLVQRMDAAARVEFARFCVASGLALHPAENVALALDTFAETRDAPDADDVEDAAYTEVEVQTGEPYPGEDWTTGSMFDAVDQ